MLMPIRIQRRRDHIMNRSLAVAAYSGFALAVLVGLVPGTAAATVIYTLNTPVSGSAPRSTPGWLTAQFLTLSQGDVRLILTSDLDVGAEYIAKFAFNIAPAILPAALTITQISGAATASIANSTQNAQSLPGGGSGGGFDVVLSFPSTNRTPDVRLNGNDVVIFDIKDLIDHITESSFAFPNAAGNNYSYVAADVRGIRADGGDSGSGVIHQGSFSTGALGAPAPEPASLALLASCIGLMTLMRRRFRAIGK